TPNSVACKQGDVRHIAYAVFRVTVYLLKSGFWVARATAPHHAWDRRDPEGAGAGAAASRNDVQEKVAGKVVARTGWTIGLGEAQGKRDQLACTRVVPRNLRDVREG